MRLRNPGVSREAKSIVPEMRSQAAGAVLSHTGTHENEHGETLERDHWGRSALMRDGAVVEIFDEGIDAYDAGLERFGKGNFAVTGVGVLSTGYRVIDPPD